MGNRLVTAWSQERRRQEAFRGRAIVPDLSVERFRGLPEELRDDAEIALAAIHQDLDNGAWVSRRLKSNKEFVLQAVKDKGLFLKHASKELQADREVVVAAVQQYGGALYHTSQELCNDREIVLEAVRENGEALEYASDELRADREIVLTAVQRFGYALCHASEEFRGDREIVLVAVRQNFLLLRYASEELRGDQSFMLTAVRMNGLALRFAPVEIRGDRDVVLEAVGQHSFALQYVSDELCGDRGIVLAALANTKCRYDVKTYILPFVSYNLQNDPMVAGVIIRKGGCLRLGSEIMERLENVLLAVRALPEAFVENVVDEESVIKFSRQWEHSTWHKIWMSFHLEPPGMQGTGRLFVELSSLPLELKQARELSHCAPVVGAILSLSRDWRDLNSYLA